MQKKIGTILDEELLKKTKEKASAEHTTVSHLFQEALREYLQKKERNAADLSVIESSFGVLKISPKALKIILEEDIHETY